MPRYGSDISKRQFLKKCLAFSAGMACFPASGTFAGLSRPDQSPGRKIAMFQEETPRGIMCRICPNECVLREGELSQCNNRRVIRSRLYTLAYGNPCSANVDPIEKKPFYHFLPGSRAYSIATAGCNLACLNCQNWSISQTSPDKTRNYDLMPVKIIEECVSRDCKSIAYTYTEPVTFYEYTYETASLAKKAGIKNILKTNGYINQEPLRQLCTVIDAANVDLKSFNNNTYLRLTGGKLQPVLDSLLTYRDMGVWLEITYLIVPAWTDNTDEIRQMCRWLSNNGLAKSPIHFSRFYPTHKLQQLPPTPVETLEKASKIAAGEGLLHVYTGNVPGNQLSDTKCPSCGDTVISRQGYRVASNTLREGKCPKCAASVEGIWT